MKRSTSKIDVRESVLRRTGNLLDILLIDRTTNKNIIWATDSYEMHGKGFSPNESLEPKLVTGVYGLLIQPRAAKPIAEQRRRTKEHAEVFTPTKVIDSINKSVEVGGLPNNETWQEYVRELKIEITCGEAPFIVSRYNPTSHTGKLIKLENRFGFLDRKLKVVSKYCNKHADWMQWAKTAFKASYGYEWQGDNILLARENLLYTFIDYYHDKFERRPTVKLQEEIAEIISWNIFQMDGLKCVVPMSCHHESKVVKGELTLFEKKPDFVEKHECEGCKYNRLNKHNGRYVKIMDWDSNKTVRFVDLVNKSKRKWNQ